jgi:hypothetical protein
MIAQQKRDALSSEISALDGLLADIDEDDFIARTSLAYRRDDLAAELAKLGEALQNYGRVVLSFEGRPVTGSHGIDARFAGKTLADYQDLISKQVFADGVGTLAQRGPVPARDAAKLNITNVLHGSFGFELEEHGTEQMLMLDTPVKKAISAVDEILAAFASPNEGPYQTALATVDRRLFISVQAFFEDLYRDSAALKIYETDREYLLDQYGVLRARERIVGVDVIDEEYRQSGELLGLTPVSRTFDFQPRDGGPVISGKVGQRLSDDYLERLHGQERISGKPYVAVMSRRRATRADGSYNESFMLLDLENDDGPADGGHLTDQRQV